MSGQSWTEEFYFFEGDELAQDQYTDLDRLNHAELKWKGVLPENLAKHELTKPPISLESNTCAFCCRYLCSACFVTKTLGYTCVATYEIATNNNNPQLMLDLIVEVRNGIKTHDQKTAPAAL